MKHSIILFTVACILISCGGIKKKVLVMAKGDLKIEGNKITIKNGSGHTEKEMMLSGSKQEIVIDNNGTISSEKINENGYYILNLKTDTVVGSYQRLGKDLNNQTTITFEQLKVIIDSLNNLVLGKNVSASNKNYLIAPNQLALISANIEANIYGPYRQVSATQELGPNGKEPEIYKFYTNKEMRELIESRAKMIPSSNN